RIGSVVRGFVYAGGRKFRSDYSADPLFPADTLRSLAGDGQEMTYLGVPPRAGTRRRIDQDGESFLDRVEVLGGSEPAHSASRPARGQRTLHAPPQGRGHSAYAFDPGGEVTRRPNHSRPNSGIHSGRTPLEAGTSSMLPSTLAPERDG